ncbi:protein Dok-7 isoform X2 [Kryptolebias marmoratus]|uniref:protein Dok-7 isoform X2 n=1 Tax=Kryptolebias marmoratus TaxID=37003 RepID=UPI0007F92212|nr:protein Dok-7 isoform X2 [Kryptolebias marmoratus]
MTDSVVVEGYARLRDGKKWKTRWLVFRKPSPVADCLVLLVFKDKSDKVQGNKERASVTLEEICGLEPGQWYEGVAFTLVLLCLNQAALLGFDSREALQAWDVRLRYSLGEVHRFNVCVLPATKLESGPATLHLCNNLLALVRDFPPLIVAHWNLPDLRRYGPVPNGFVFEGGTRCGYWAGVFLLASAESEQISLLFDCVVRGISPSRGPFGLRPVLPELSSSQTDSEEKLNLEAQELEKRLSMLSHGSSTVSSTYYPSAGGDNRSISGSSDTSDTSQSDCSIGSRLTIWTESASNPPGSVDHVGAKAALQTADKLSANPGGGGSRLSPKPPRQLQEIGRQSSSDSGIASGSHSSCTGSFSSYTGSLDITAPGEDFGSVFNLPPRLARDLSPCTCPPTVPGNEYHVPTSLRYLYDTPRSLLHEAGGGVSDNEPPTPAKEPPVPSDLPAGSMKGGPNRAPTSEGPSEPTDRQSVSETSQGLSEGRSNTKVAPSSDSYHTCTPLTSVSKTIVTICSTCGGFKGTQSTHLSSSVIPTIPVKQLLQRSRPSPGPAAELPGAKTGRQPEARPHRPNPYESMSPALGNGLHLAPTGPLQESQQDKRAVVYENCLKCRGERCQPPPQVVPAKACRSSRDLSSSRPLPAGPHLKRRSGREEELLGDAEGQSGEEINGSEVTEDKKLTKEERRRADPAYEIMESRVAERNSEPEEKSKYELMGSCGQQRFLQEAEGLPIASPPEAPLPEKPRSDSVTYVNIPISPTSKKQLNYMELELQELAHSGRGTVAQLPAQRKSCTRYAQIDINATEAAHKVGAQHALGRQEGLHTVELRRKGMPH